MVNNFQLNSEQSSNEMTYLKKHSSGKNSISIKTQKTNIEVKLDMNVVKGLWPINVILIISA